MQNIPSLAGSSNAVQGSVSSAMPGLSGDQGHFHGPPVIRALESFGLSAEVQGPLSISPMTSPGALGNASSFPSGASGYATASGSGPESTATAGLSDGSAHFHGPPMFRMLELIGFSPDLQGPFPISAMASPGAPPDAADAADAAASLDAQGAPAFGGYLGAFGGGQDRGLHDPHLGTPLLGTLSSFSLPDPSALVASVPRLRFRGDPTTAATPDQAPVLSVGSAPALSMPYDVAALTSLSATVQALSAARAATVPSELGVARATTGPETNAAANRSSAGTPRRDEIGTDVATDNQTEIPIASQTDRSVPVIEALPQPRGAGLIAEIVALDGAAVEATVARLLERFNDLGSPVESPAAGLPSPALVAAAIVSIEFSRRWFARRKRGVTITVRRQEGLALHGFS